MKKLITLLFVLFTLTSISQDPHKKYPMYSDIWRYDVVSNMILPKNNESFNLKIPDHILDSINEDKIRYYLLESFNEFRKDYEKEPVKESMVLTKQAQDYSVILSNKSKIEHSSKEYRNGASECIAIVDVSLFSCVKEGEDINKIISDSFFDIFTPSYSHMYLLLKDYRDYGFGFYRVGNKFAVVVQMKKGEI